MGTLNQLKSYLTHHFSTGCYIGEDYKTFQNKYINHLRSLCRKNDWKLVNIGRNYYCFSAFIKGGIENKYVYISISDVRYFFNDWYKHILIRTAEHETDYRGGFNHYTILDNLESGIAGLLGELPF